VSVDGLSAVSARLTEIRSLVADVAVGPPAARGSAAPSASSAAGFAAALAAATGESDLASLLAGAGGGRASTLFASDGLALAGLFTASTAAAAPAVAAGSPYPAVLNADGVPADLAAYGNGRIPEAVLAPVGDGRERMWRPAADALNALIAAAAADGVTIGVTDGYRSYDAQAQLVRTKGLYSQGGLAAAPGTSEHGWGMAADLALDSRALAWMRANAGRFGFAETTPRESWHWAYRPG
jgi:D-alanyl-D-alanine carboxypeptidase